MRHLEIAIGLIACIAAVAAVVVGIICLYYNRIAAELARRAECRDALDRVPVANALYWRDGASASVTIANVGRAAFTVYAIQIKFNGQCARLYNSLFEFTDGTRFPKFLPGGASCCFAIPSDTLEAIPVDVIPGIVLEMFDRKTLECPTRSV
jgi:hypothetical protein